MTSESAEPTDDEQPTDDSVTSQHSIATPSGRLRYTVSAGRIVLRDEVHNDGIFEGHQAKAELFVTSYTLDDSDPRTRPVTFAFNGGPGSSSVWLHLGRV